MSNKTNAKDKAERRRRKVIAMFADATNALTIQDAANILGVSAKTIERDLKKVRPDMNEAEDKLMEYQRLFKKRLPLGERVHLYEEIARQDGNLFARFKALQRIDEFDGIITEKDKLRRREQERPAPQPMFILPAGAQLTWVKNTTTSSKEVLNIGAVINQQNKAIRGTEFNVTDITQNGTDSTDND